MFSRACLGDCWSISWAVGLRVNSFVHVIQAISSVLGLIFRTLGAFWSTCKIFTRLKCRKHILELPDTMERDPLKY